MTDIGTVWKSFLGQLLGFARHRPKGAGRPHNYNEERIA